MKVEDCTTQQYEIQIGKKATIDAEFYGNELRYANDWRLRGSSWNVINLRYDHWIVWKPIEKGTWTSLKNY